MANYQSRYTGPEIDERLRKAGEAVLTEAQSLDAGKQAQARENIGAASSAAVDGKYTKPSGGIPKADLASGVQASLGKADSAYQKPASGIPASDIAEGVIPDVSQFITKTVNDLANYYLKTDTYTKDEVQQLISTIHGFSYEVVATLPAASADTMGKIYLAPSADPQSQNIKDEYITIDNGASAQTRYTWEQIGSTAVDLSGYVTTQQLNTALAAYTTSTDLATLLAAKQDVIADLADIRSGAAAGATAYQKPQGGIPATDLADKYAGSPSAGGPAFKALGIPYGAVDANSTATDIKATVDNFPETLVAGVCAYIRNDVIASASGFTLNINGTGALPVYQSLADASRVTTLFSAASTFLFVYNPTRVEGGCWDLYYGYNSNDNTVGYNLRTNGGTAVAAAKFYRYRLLFTAPDGQSLVPSNTSSSTSSTAAKTVNQAKIDPFAPIWYYSTTTAINAGSSASASYLWMQYSAIPLGYAFNRTGAALTMTARYPVYLKCAPQSDGSAIMDADTPIVQALPSTEDGKIYIFLGYAESEVNITLYYWHPVYYFKDGAIRQWTNAAAASITVDQTYDGTSTNAQSGVAMAGALAGKQDTIDAQHKLDYSLLSNTPTIPAAQVNSDWNAGSGVAQILNKPNLATVATSGSYDDLSDKPVVDATPTANSNNLVKSGGVFNAIEDVIEAIDGSNVETVTALPTASASTVGKIYYVGPDGNGEYARYRGIESGGSYSFLPLGSTEMDLTNYATKGEVANAAKCGDDDSDDSLNIGDNSGNVLMSISSGHVRTKAFDSSKIRYKQRIDVGDDETNDDLNIGDEAGNVLISLSDGNIKTKRFDSRVVENVFSVLNVVALGDSITWAGGANCDDEDGWTYWFKQKAGPKSCRSYAASGATLCYQPSWQTQNDAYMQLQNLLSDKGQGMYPDGVDLIFLAFGTNDLGNSADKYSVTAEEEFNNATEYATYNHSDLTSFAKAIRYICEQLYVNFPDVQIVFITPQQRSNFPTSMLKNMGDFIESCADYLGINTIRLDKHCGTYHTREIVEHHKLNDGTHTTQLGARENGYFIFNNVKPLLKF